MATFAGWECVDPASFARACAAQNPPIDISRWHGKAGSFTVPLGRGPGRGWVLLTGAALAAIDPTADHPLVFVGSDPAHVRTFPRITLLRAECCAPGSAADPAAVYACELADRRHLLAMIPAPNRAYNLRKSDGSDDYLPASINGLAPWSWQDVADDLVAALGLTDIFLLPFEPDGVPESLAYYAPGSAWDALCDVLARLECAAEYDPEADTFAVVRLGAADATFAAADAALARARLWDGYGAEAVRAWRPETVRTVFRRVPPPTDGTSPYYVVDTALGAAAGVEPGTAVQVEDDLIARVPPGSPGGTPANLADLTARAAERASDWLRRRAGFDAPLLRTYLDYQPAGALLGSRVHAVVFDDRGGPFATTIYSAPTAPWKPAETMPPALTAPLWAPGPRPTSGTSGPSASGPDDNGFPGRRFPGDGRDPVAVRDVQCVEGVLYRTTGRQQVVQDDDGRARLDWYALQAVRIGCCACSGSGSGPGSGAVADCCPNGHDPTVDVELTGPFAADCGPLDLAGTATFDDATGAWIGTATGGSVSALVVLSCDGQAWHLYAIVTLADGTQVVADDDLETEGEALVGTLELSDGTGCDDAALSVIIGHPCVTAPECLCAGFAACTDVGPAKRYTFTLEGATGDFVGANGDWTVVQVNEHPETDGCRWRGTKGDWYAELIFRSPTAAQLFVGDGAASATYLGTGSICCDALTAWVLDAFVGAGDKPAITDDTVNPADCGAGCGAVTTTCCGATTVPAVLEAHFSGALASFGTVTLTYTGTQWEGEANNGAGCQTNVQFRCGASGFSVTMGGPGTVGSVAETAATTCSPFSWTGSGTASVNCAGAFGMTVDTTP